MFWKLPQRIIAISKKKPYYDRGGVVIHCGDSGSVMEYLEEKSFSCCVTSPPYWGLRDYGTATWVGGDAECSHLVRENSKVESSTLAGGRKTTGHQKEGFKDRCPRCGAKRVDNQIGLEETPDLYVSKMVEVFRQVGRVLKDDGTLWLNLGDSYTSGGRDTFGSFQADSKQATNAAIKKSPRAAQPPGLKEKDLVGIPWRVAFALQADGWYLRQDIIWHKPNPMPESVTDRCTKAHEYIFLLSKSAKYHYDAKLIAEPCTDSSLARWNQDIDNQAGSDRVPGKTNGPMKSVGGKRKVNGGASFGKQNYDTAGTGAQSRQYERPVYESRNRRSVWTVTTKPYKGAHFATFPPDLIEPCILAGCPAGETVLDPFNGAGTTALVARKNGRKCIGIELNEDYCKIAAGRLAQAVLPF